MSPITFICHRGEKSPAKVQCGSLMEGSSDQLMIFSITPSCLMSLRVGLESQRAIISKFHLE